MNQHQFKLLLDTYGASPSNWPEDRRAAAQAHVAGNEYARDLLIEYQSFDDALDRFEVAIDTQSLRSRILAQLPEQRPVAINRLIDWLIPNRKRPLQLWRPAIAAILPLIVGVVLGSTINLGTTYAVDTWEDEVYLLGLAVEEPEVLP